MLTGNLNLKRIRSPDIEAASNSAGNELQFGTYRQILRSFVIESDNSSYYKRILYIIHTLSTQSKQYNNNIQQIHLLSRQRKQTANAFEVSDVTQVCMQMEPPQEEIDFESDHVMLTNIYIYIYSTI